MLTSFPPVSATDSRVLILGSMPGVQSLEAQQYYAHPRNLFWHFMADFFEFEYSSDYSDRILQLKQNHIALWDVLQHCQRAGSLDSDINTDSMVTNDFEAFFNQHEMIQQVFFNGKKAEQIYIQKVLPGLPETMQQIQRIALPSTSPANASITKQVKLDQWRQVYQVVTQR